MKKIALFLAIIAVYQLSAQIHQGKIYCVGNFTCGFIDQGANSLISTGTSMLAILADSNLYQYKPGHGYLPVPAGNN